MLHSLGLLFPAKLCSAHAFFFLSVVSYASAPTTLLYYTQHPDTLWRAHPRQVPVCTLQCPSILLCLYKYSHTVPTRAHSKEMAIPIMQSSSSFPLLCSAEYSPALSPPTSTHLISSGFNTLYSDWLLPQSPLHLLLLVAIETIAAVSGECCNMKCGKPAVH